MTRRQWHCYCCNPSDGCLRSQVSLWDNFRGQREAGESVSLISITAKAMCHEVKRKERIGTHLPFLIVFVCFPIYLCTVFHPPSPSLSLSPSTPLSLSLSLSRALTYCSVSIPFPLSLIISLTFSLFFPFPFFSLSCSHMLASSHSTNERKPKH